MSSSGGDGPYIRSPADDIATGVYVGIFLTGFTIGFSIGVATGVVASVFIYGMGLLG